MGYFGKSNLINNNPYAKGIYSTHSENGNPPPFPPNRFLLLENGQFLLLETGGKIELENGTP